MVFKIPSKQIPLGSLISLLPAWVPWLRLSLSVLHGPGCDAQVHPLQEEWGPHLHLCPCCWSLHPCPNVPKCQGCICGPGPSFLQSLFSPTSVYPWKQLWLQKKSPEPGQSSPSCVLQGWLSPRHENHPVPSGAGTRLLLPGSFWLQ